MFKVSVEDVSLYQNSDLKILIEYDKMEEYQNINITLFDVAVKNPTFKFSTGSTLKKISENLYELSINIGDLAFGFYEVKSITLQTTEPSSGVNLVSIKDFNRILLEVIPSMQNKKSAQEILNEVSKDEKFYHDEFLKPIDIRADKTNEANTYYAFVFIKKMLISAQVKFHKYALLPTNKGLNKEHHLNFVNDFLTNRTKTGIKFLYTEERKKHETTENPVCVTYFPTIIASDIDEVVEYTQQETNILLQALALLRESSGEIFNIIIVNKTTGEASNSIPREPYYGNKASGIISGENPEKMATYIDGLNKNPINSFLVHLYKEAQKETSQDFKYIRYWQILETIADNQNYNETDVLLDYENNPITRNGTELKIKGAKHYVFNLLREYKMTSSESMWENVNIWIAFRNSVSHFGSISEYKQLSSNDDKVWAEQGHNVIIKKGYDNYLMELQRNVKLILEKIIVGTTN